MRDGVIVAAGPPAEVITADNVRDVFGLDCVVIDDPVSHTPLVVPIGSRHADPRRRDLGPPSADRSGHGFERHARGTPAMAFLLWLVAAILVIVGIVQLFQGQIIFGVLLIIAGCPSARADTASSAVAPDRHPLHRGTTARRMRPCPPAVRHRTNPTHAARTDR